MSTNPISEQLTSLEGTLNEYFGKKAPAMPDGIKDFLVTIAPYLSILGILFAIPALIAWVGLIGFGGALIPAATMGAISLPPIILSLVLAIPPLVLQIMAIPGLFSRSEKAWRFLFWAQLITIISQAVQLNLLGLIVGTVIGFYVLFQVKDRYK